MEALKESQNEVRAEYISRIEIESLWGRKHKHIVWNLRRDVNILSGVNGIGKSTILNRAADQLDHMCGGVDVKVKDIEGVKMTFYPEEATTIHFDVIRSFDRPLFHSNLAEKMADKNVKAELDWQLYQLQRRYLNSQVNIGTASSNFFHQAMPKASSKRHRYRIPRDDSRIWPMNSLPRQERRLYAQRTRLCSSSKANSCYPIAYRAAKSRYW